MANQDLILVIKKEAKNYFKKSLPSHDWTHTERVYKLCMDIGKKENANLFALQLAALLHDIGREKEIESKGKKDHAEISKNLAIIILKKYNIDNAIINQVLECIDSHRFRVNKIPKTKEARILFDADKLDCIGAIGVARAYAWAGEQKLKLYPGEGNEKNYLGTGYEKIHTPVAEFMFKLKTVKNKLFTKTAKQIAGKRHNFMLKFFNQLNKELEE